MRREMIVAGNGASLRKMPREFLESRPLFAMNHFVYYADIQQRYWTAWDTIPLDDNIPHLKAGTSVILHPRLKGYMINQGLLEKLALIDLSFWANYTPIPGLGWGGSVYYTSSLHWAISIGFNLLGYTDFLVAGFDCSMGNGVYMGKGKGAGPHFYDPKGGGGKVRYAKNWDEQLWALKKHLWPLGGNITNISPGSMAKLVPPEDWRNYV